VGTLNDDGTSREAWAAFKGGVRNFVRQFANVVPSWDEYFHFLALAAASRSKDPRRMVGAVIASADRVVLATGYNGFPRGVKDSSERWKHQREKLKWVCHAEANAIFNAARSGASLQGCTIYVTTFPCSRCAQAIAQAGIARVFTHGEYWFNDENGYEKALDVFAEAGVQVDAPEMRERDHDDRLRGRELRKNAAASQANRKPAAARRLLRSAAKRSNRRSPRRRR
jgi:dCMP deaminase